MPKITIYGYKSYILGVILYPNLVFSSLSIYGDPQQDVIFDKNRIFEHFSPQKRFFGPEIIINYGFLELS